jgi:hypothetical protein
VDTPPTVLSSVRADANPTNRFSVSFTVTFSESVTGVDTGDFNLTKTGPIHGETVTSVTGGPIIYTVSVNTGTGNGTLRLNVVDNNTIVDATSNPLGGAAVGDGNFNGGQTYTVTHFALFLPLIEASLTASPSTNQGVLSDLPAYPGP